MTQKGIWIGNVTSTAVLILPLMALGSCTMDNERHQEETMRGHPLLHQKVLKTSEGLLGPSFSPENRACACRTGGLPLLLRGWGMLERKVANRKAGRNWQETEDNISWCRGKNSFLYGPPPACFHLAVDRKKCMSNPEHWAAAGMRREFLGVRMKEKWGLPNQQHPSENEL